MDNGTSAAIRPLTGEFKDATLEREFVASTWPAVARQTHLAGLLGAAVYLLASYIDYVGLGLVPAYYGLLAVRTMVAVAMVGFVAASLWRRDPQFTQVGVLGVAALVVVGLLTCAIVKQQDGDFRATTIITLILIYYFLVPNRLLYATTAAVGSSVIYIVAILAFMPNSGAEALFTGLMLVLANALGFSALKTLNRVRRRDFDARRCEELKNRQLQQEIMERQVREAELRETRDRLQQRTEHLTEISSGLEQARAEAVNERTRALEANASKSRFLANMSHELRTPLNAVIGFSQMLRDEMLGPVGQRRYVEYASDIHAAGQHLLALINDVLDLAKIEAGRIELRPEPIDLPVLLAELDRLCQIQSRDSGVQIVRSIDDHFPRLSADYRAVKQMLLNLITNALKFTPRGGSVLLSTAIAADGGLQLSVADTGIGIAAADLERIFTPFEQVDDSLSRQHSGSGLGLALVKTLIELHHGSVSINSKLGAGTTVTLHFPSGAIIADLGQTRNGNPKRQAGNY